MDLQQARATFNHETAAELAAQVGDFTRLPGTGYSKRFAYFANDDQFLVVAGPQETNHVELAFALGLTYRQGRHLMLALPRDHAFSTLQRAPWFNEDARPDIWLHDGHHIAHDALPSQDHTIQALSGRLKPNQTLADELRDAATAVHLGTRASSVQELAEWATTEPLLDPSHRRGERSWHCMGQRVLSIKPTTGGVAITAGIHYTKPDQAPTALPIGKNQTLSPADLHAIKHQVRAGMHERLHGAPPIHRPDEHWLQAVIRRDPSLVGVEQPALRELPAWRPTGQANEWGRGYIDLIGIDGHGDIRVVETKIADNKDALLVMQGLDYYVWTLAYRDVVLGRLGASAKADIEIHYVIGADQNGAVALSPYTASQALGLNEEIPWHFQHVYDWYGDPSGDKRARSELLPLQTLPT